MKLSAKTIVSAILATAALAAQTVMAKTVLTLPRDSLADSPAGVTIRGIAYAGSGCPAGSVAENISNDAKALTLLFDSYVAEVGPGVPFSEQRKNCQIAVDLQFPSGWSFSIIDVDYRGYASLEPGVIGTQKASYYFQGQSRTGNLQTNLYGPVTKDYHIRDTLGVDAQVWSPCGASRALNINSQVRVDNSRNTRARGVMTLDSVDAQITHVYGLQWRRCN